MVGVKTNERPGTRSQVRFVRMSASKARVVLNLIRDKHVAEANQILAFNERLASEVIGKCLRAAVANAVHNEEIPAEELYVSACYADEGPVLRRFRPRARGRAGRINKQTCHITIVVSRYSDDELEARRSRDEQRAEAGGRGRNADAAADRRRRVARSRAAEAGSDESAAEADDDATSTVEDTAVEDTVVEDAVVEATVVEDAAVEDEAVVEDAGADDEPAEKATAKKATKKSTAKKATGTAAPEADETTDDAESEEKD